MRSLVAEHRSPNRRRSLLIGAVLVAVAACSNGGVPLNDANLRTYPVRAPGIGEENLCPASIAVDPVVGELAGDPNASGDQSWLTTKDGERLYIVWPQGFSLSFEPGPVLRNERGRVVAEAGTKVTLSQVNRFDHAGTTGDPFLALGSLFGSCYQKAAS